MSVMHGYEYNTRHEVIVPVAYQSVNSTERVRIHRGRKYYRNLLDRGVPEDRARELTRLMFKF